MIISIKTIAKILRNYYRSANAKKLSWSFIVLQGGGESHRNTLIVI